MKRSGFLELESFEILVPYTQKKRRIRILLPANYLNEEERYPVIYMHDGQNIFYSREAFCGYSWKTIPAIKTNNSLPKMIIVGIDNANENRLFEYSAWKFENDNIFKNEMEVFGREYGEFVVDVLKPYIDKNYRTKPEKEFTAMVGSSLGASISQYLGAKYSDVFGFLGIFSTANWLFQNSFNNFIEDVDFNNQKIFIMVGTNEYNDGDAEIISGNISQYYIDSSLSYYRQLLENGININDIDLVVAAGERHSERSWAKYLPRCLKFFSDNW